MNNMRNKILSLLVLLLTAATGAWADETPIVTITATGSGPAYSVEGIVTLETGGAGYGAGYGWVSGSPNNLTVTAADGVTITKVKFFGNQGSSWEDTESPFQVLLQGYYVKNASGTKIGSDDGVTKIEVYGVAPPTVTFNDAKTTASFEMPAYDATVSYELVRDITQKVDVEVRIDGTATECVRIAKDGDGHYKFVTKQEWGWQFAAVDKLDNNKDLTNGELNYTFKMKEGNDYVAKNFDTNLCPGTWRLEATANAEKPYEGTAYGKDIELYTGYEVTVPAGEYATLFVKEAVVVDEGSTDAVLYTIANVTESEAQLSEAIKVAPKETPLLVYNKSEESKTFLLIPTAATADEVSVAKEFKGTLVEMEMPASSATVDYYVCTGSAFMWVRDAGVIAANRCWLQIGEQPAASRAKTRSIVGGGDTTSLRGVNSEVVNSEDYYDLQGRKVAKPTRGGIYIHNGKKVIIH